MAFKQVLQVFHSRLDATDIDTFEKEMYNPQSLQSTETEFPIPSSSSQLLNWPDGQAAPARAVFHYAIPLSIHESISKVSFQEANFIQEHKE